MFLINSSYKAKRLPTFQAMPHFFANVARPFVSFIYFFKGVAYEDKIHVAR